MGDLCDRSFDSTGEGDGADAFAWGGPGGGDVLLLVIAVTAVTAAAAGFSAMEDVRRSFTPLRPSFSRPFFRFLPLSAHCSSSPGGTPLPPPAPVAVPASSSSRKAALSASSCCFRNASNCSVVSFFSAASLARVDSRTESRNSTSSSSSERNWFFSLMDSSKASCLRTWEFQSNRR